MALAHLAGPEVALQCSKETEVALGEFIGDRGIPGRAHRGQKGLGRPRGDRGGLEELKGIRGGPCRAERTEVALAVLTGTRVGLGRVHRGQR